MKFPFDPHLLQGIQGIFILILIAIAIGHLWVAWTLLVVGLMHDIFG